MAEKQKDEDILYLDVDEFFKGKKIDTVVIESEKKEGNKNDIINKTKK